jgi:hypothetical protein
VSFIQLAPAREMIVRFWSLHSHHATALLPGHMIEIHGPGPCVHLSVDRSTSRWTAYRPFWTNITIPCLDIRPPHNQLESASQVVELVENPIPRCPADSTILALESKENTLESFVRTLRSQERPILPIIELSTSCPQSSDSHGKSPSKDNGLPYANN